MAADFVSLFKKLSVCHFEILTFFGEYFIKLKLIMNLNY